MASCISCLAPSVSPLEIFSAASLASLAALYSSDCASFTGWAVWLGSSSTGPVLFSMSRVRSPRRLACSRMSLESFFSSLASAARSSSDCAWSTFSRSSSWRFSSFSAFFFISSATFFCQSRFLSSSSLKSSANFLARSSSRSASSLASISSFWYISESAFSRSA